MAADLGHGLPGAWVADPELVGFGLHRLLPPGRRDDFQATPAWRFGVIEVLDATLGGMTDASSHPRHSCALIASKRSWARCATGDTKSGS